MKNNDNKHMAQLRSEMRQGCDIESLSRDIKGGKIVRIRKCSTKGGEKALGILYEKKRLKREVIIGYTDLGCWVESE